MQTKLHTAQAREHAADLVERLSALPLQQAVALIDILPFAEVVEAFDHPEFDDAAAILARLPTDYAAGLLSNMSADRAARLLGRADPDTRRALIPLLDASTTASLAGLMAYPDATAGAMMTTEFVSMPVGATVQQTLDHIRAVERTRETIYAIYLVDEQHRLVQTLSLRRLITGAPDAPALSLARGTPPLSVPPLTDREDVARLISRYDLLALPVLDDERRVLGIVTVDDVIDAIVAESTEDVHRFGGVAALDKPYLQAGFGTMIRKRAGWLCALFLSEMLTASAMQHFSDELAKAVVLTLFIPLIMSSGGNSGSQATSLVIRALALGELRLRDWWRVALRELPAGLVLGAILGVIGVGRIALWQTAGIYDYGPHWRLVATTVGTGLIGIVAFGSLAGSMLPFALQRLGFDPASASAPFVATLVDVTGLVIYFSVALLILSGTLL